MAALRLQYSVGIGQAAIDHAVVVVSERRVFVGCGANLGAFGGTALAQILSAQRCIEPGCGSPVERVAENHAFTVTVADVRDQKTGLANARSGGSGGVRHPDERNVQQAEIRVYERNVFVHSNAGAAGKELPFRVL